MNKSAVWNSVPYANPEAWKPSAQLRGAPSSVDAPRSELPWVCTALSGSTPLSLLNRFGAFLSLLLSMGMCAIMR